jgi:tRNA threonylcarbamoyladenosine biosynthesis protein TsaE
MARLELISLGPQDTHRIGQLLAQGLSGGERLLLEGQLGAGKTALIRGLAAGLGHDESRVSSPTYVLMHEYRSIGSITLLHLDAYRLTSSDDLDALGFDAAAQGGPTTVAAPIAAIEWPSRLPDLASRFHEASVVMIRMAHLEPDVRSIELDVPAAWLSRSGIRELAARASGPAISQSPTRQLADLYRWLTGGYTISRPATEADFDEP